MDKKMAAYILRSLREDFANEADSQPPASCFDFKGYTMSEESLNQLLRALDAGVAALSMRKRRAK